VGLAIGLILLGVHKVLVFAGILSPAIQMIAIISAYYLICGGIHLDGVADVWDGMNCGGSRDKIFQAMSDSCVGTFGVIGLILIAGMAGLSTATASGLDLFLAPLVGRSFGLLLISTHSAAKSKGLGKPMIDACGKKTAAFAILILMALALVQIQAIWAYLVILILFLIKFRPFLNRIGGVTGDTIGFTIEMTQWLFLLILQGGHLI
jgi:adenosylcobinamide-GDP ribazoletransferase